MSDPSPDVPRRSFILITGVEDAGGPAVAAAIAELAPRGVCLDRGAGEQLHDAVAAAIAADARVITLWAECASPEQVHALRAAVLPLTGDTSAWRVTSAAAPAPAEHEAAARRGDLGRPIDMSDGDASRAAALIWQARNRAVHVVPYDDGWPHAFADEQARVQDVLSTDAGRIHHIGSTAVPGLHAKPIIDVMVEVDSLAAAREQVGALYDAGYVFNDYPQNTDRMVFTRQAEHYVHLHLVERGSSELERHLRFRDALRADAGLRDAYGALKLRLAEKHPDDRHGYSNAKSDFIRAADSERGPQAQ